MMKCSEPDVLDPMPISFAPPQSEDEHQPSAGASGANSGCRLVSATLLNTKKVSFELFKVTPSEEQTPEANVVDSYDYILQMTEETGDITRYGVSARDGKEVKVNDLPNRTYPICPVVEEISWGGNRRYKLSLHERLQGWSVEERRRRSGVINKFYRHNRAKKTFRSLVEAAIFNLFSCSPTDFKRFRDADAAATAVISVEPEPAVNGDVEPGNIDGNAPDPFAGIFDGLEPLTDDRGLPLLDDFAGV